MPKESTVGSTNAVETLLLVSSRGLLSRVRIWLYRTMGMKIGRRCRIEKIRARNLRLVEIGDFNALTEGCWLWPTQLAQNGPAIRIGHGNYFNRDVVIDACGCVEIGDANMFGPRVYITDSDHQVQFGTPPGEMPMQVGRVKIGDRCWIGAHAVILKDVELGDECVVAAGAVVTRSFPPKSRIAGVPARLMEPARQ